jgi:hypothetical protein
MNIWEYTKGLLLIFGVPILGYLFAMWDPFLVRDEIGDPVRLGLYGILVPYWVVLFFAHKYWSENKNLKAEKGKPRVRLNPDDGTAAFAIWGHPKPRGEKDQFPPEEQAYHRPPKGWQPQKKDDKDIV